MQVKREEAIGPTKEREIADEVTTSDAIPYGVLFAHLLFAYFEVSLQVRRRSLRTECSADSQPSDSWPEFSETMESITTRRSYAM